MVEMKPSKLSQPILNMEIKTSITPPRKSDAITREINLKLFFSTFSENQGKIFPNTFSDQNNLDTKPNKEIT